jgi:hypothetical protein
MFRLVLQPPNVQTTKPSGNSSFCKSLGHLHVQVLHAKLMTNCTMQASAAANLLNICIQVLYAKPSSSPNVKTRTQRFCKLLQISWTFACSSFCCCKSLEKENIYIQVLHAKLIITSMCKPPNPAAIRASAATNVFNIRIQVLARQAHHHQMCTNHQTQQQCKQASAAANLL